MRRFFFLLGCVLVFTTAVPVIRAADAALPGEPAAAGMTDQERATMAAAIAASGADRTAAQPPDFLEHIVDLILELFNVRTSGNTVTHYAISAALLMGALLLRRIVTGVIFSQLRRLAAKTETTLDDKLFPALEVPAATFVMVTGIFASLKVLKLSAETDRYIGYGSNIAFSLVIFWILLRAFNALLEHAQELATAKQSGIAAFMPWIRKSLVTAFVVIGVLLTVQGLGYDVKALLAGLGIGGLAFALATQDTIANLFGSIVVAIDQPFKVGETVQIGANAGAVEDIGLRSTKLRRADKSLLIIPNKTVAAEVVINQARFTRRRVEQVIGLTYDTTPEQMEAIVADIRRSILAEPEVDPGSVMVYFRDFSASSLDLWLVYESPDPDLQKSLQLRQRLNLAFMRVISARGLEFAFPTQAIRLEGEIAEKLAENKTESDRKQAQAGS